MMIQVIESSTNENGCKSIQLETEKKSLSIFVGRSFTTVCVKNASHKVWRGAGRTFHGENTLQQAFESYKDSAVKAMIQHAIEMTA